MPSQEQIMSQILALFGAGAALPTAIPATDVLRERYFDWIVVAKPGLQSPQDLWETTTGLMLQGKFGQIGALAAAKTRAAGNKLVIEAEECLTACVEVEETSDCPHCP